MRARFAGLLTLGVVAAVGVAPAQATIFERFTATDEPYMSGVAGFPDPVFCGITVHIEGTFDSRGHFRLGKGKFDGAFFGHDRFSLTETWTANGKSVTVTGSAVFQEVKAIPRGDDLFEFFAIEAGQPFRLFDSDGNLLLRDRGAIRFHILFDTLGDEEPGGVVVEEFEPRVSGPHPGFFDESLCPVLVPLLSA